MRRPKNTGSRILARAGTVRHRTISRFKDKKEDLPGLRRMPRGSDPLGRKKRSSMNHPGPMT